MKIFDRKELVHLWPFYLEAFLGTILFVNVPFMVLYFSSISMTPWQIGLLMAVTPLSMFIFEIPTGAVADLYGRKISVILGWTLAGILSFLVYFFRDFISLLIIFFLIGFAFSFTSGSYDAWVVDLIKAKKLHTSSYFSKKSSLYGMAFIFSGILGAFLVERFGLAIVWPVTGAAFLISVFFLSFGEEVYDRKKVRIKESFKELRIQTLKSIRYAKNHHVLSYLLTISVLFAIFISLTSQISWTPFLKSFDMPDSWFGYLWSASGVLMVIAPLIYLKLFKKFRERNILIFSSALFVLTGIVCLFANSLFFSISLILAFYFILDFQTPIENTYLHKFLPTKMRSTIGSVKNMLFSFSGAAGTVLAGFLVSQIGARYTLVMSAILMIPIIFLYTKIKAKRMK
jgi:DHA3 family tetracycline resistance protein-like MFS transporter